MLETLNIRNLATVSELDVIFAPGLNALSGETGAGKSIILGAIQVLLGERAEKSIIRKGEASCEISAAIRFSGVYGPTEQEVQALLDNAGLPQCEEDQLILRRVVSESGSRAYVNSQPVTLNVMRRLGELLVDIHGPNDHQSLLSSSCQLQLLDTFAGLAPQVADCAEHYRALQAHRDELAALQNEHMSPAEAELLRHQLLEIDSAELDAAEEADLIARHRTASHARRLLEIANQCQRGLAEDDDCISDQLGEYVRLLHEVQELAPVGEEFSTRLEGIVDGIQELCRDMTGFAESLELDQQELMQIEERLDLIQKLKRKHSGSVDEIMNKAERIRERLAAIDHRRERIEESKAVCSQAEETLLRACESLTAMRRKAGVELSARIADKLDGLGFNRSTFEIALSEQQPGPAGQDRVEFCFAPNPGEDVMPLRKIASSGEISRVMLAVKTVLTSADQVPILVFDEVDANIGGRVAIAVARELGAIGRRHQVLCITHLPQIAAAAATHFNVGKHVVSGRTITEISALDRDGRIKELSRMMGAPEESGVAKEHAEELLRECCAQP